MLITVEHYRENSAEPARHSHVNPEHIVRIISKECSKSSRIVLTKGDWFDIPNHEAQRLINLANGEPISAPPIDLLCDVLTLCREAIGTLGSTEWRYNTLDALTRYIREEQERR